MSNLFCVTYSDDLGEDVEDGVGETFAAIELVRRVVCYLAHNFHDAFVLPDVC